MDINPMNGLFNNFVAVMKYLEIKYEYKAAKYETLEITKSADQYITALLSEDNFFSYLNYDKDFIIQVTGGVDEATLELYHMNRRNIPEQFRDSLLTLKRTRVVEQYVEKNNYYRMLNGLPDVEDTDYIIIPDDVATSLKLPLNSKLHEMDNIEITLLTDYGFIDTMKEKYPEKKYLNFLGPNRIPILTSRKARPFGIMRIPNTLSTVFIDKFKLIYEQCREYFMACIYIPEYRQVIDYYDNFIGLSIMIMTMQQVVARSGEVLIQRDFFDIQTVKMMYDSYHVPFIELLDEANQRAILQNLNVLIQYKGTDKVLYDISSLLGYDAVKIYKYYLVKERLFGDDGIPVNMERLVKNEFGEMVLEPDYQSMYDIYFQRVELKEQDYYNALQTKANRVEYTDVVLNDPYWWEDATLTQELYETEFNIAESKYLNMNISYKLSEVMFETVYLLKMIMEKKDSIQGISLILPKIFDDRSVSLFSAVIALCAMLCKKNSLRGEILIDPSKILYVLGFNFHQDFAVLRDHIRDNPYLDNELVTYIENLSAITPSNVNALYSSIRSLRDYLTEKISISSEIREYRAYLTLYETLYITEESRSVFNIGTEEVPEYPATYLDYLRIISPEFYDFINNTEKDVLFEYIDHIITKMTDLIPSIKYLYLVNDTSSAVQDALIKLVNFFKSYTTDMLGMNIVYIFDTKAGAMLKLIDAANLIQKYIYGYETKAFPINDKIRKIVSALRIKDYDTFTDQLQKLMVALNVTDKTSLYTEKVGSGTLSSIKISDDDQVILDRLRIHVLLKIGGNLIEFSDKKRLIAKLVANELITYREGLIISAFLKIKEDTTYFDATSYEKSTINHKESFLPMEYMYITSLYYGKSDWELWDIINMESNVTIPDDTMLFGDTYKLTWSESV